jgi:hypothetical protein
MDIIRGFLSPKKLLTFSPYVVWALVPAVTATLILTVFAFWHVKKLRFSAARVAFGQACSP